VSSLSFSGWTSIFVGMGYLFYCAYGFELDPHKKFYNKLFSQHTFIIHFLVTFIIFCFGYYRCSYGKFQETFYFTPFIFLITLVFFNWLTRLILNRNIIISSRWDSKPPEYKWYIDGFFSYLVILMSILFPGLAMNKFRFGTFFQ
jgi:hypothetical protein